MTALVEHEFLMRSRLHVNKNAQLMQILLVQRTVCPAKNDEPVNLHRGVVHILQKLATLWTGNIRNRSVESIGLAKIGCLSAACGSPRSLGALVPTKPNNIMAVLK
jgi:hypothetical protein